MNNRTLTLPHTPHAPLFRVETPNDEELIAGETSDHRSIHWSAAQHIGSREGQEDAYLVGKGFAVVADGMGGHEHGERASQAAVRTPLTSYPRTTAASMTDNVIASGGHTTVVWARATADWIEVGAVGDSQVALATFREDGDVDWQYLTPPGNEIPWICENSIGGNPRDVLDRYRPAVFMVQRIPWPERAGVIFLFTDGCNPTLDLRAAREPTRWEKKHGVVQGVGRVRSNMLPIPVIGQLRMLHGGSTVDPTRLVRTLDWILEDALAHDDRPDNATIVAGWFGPRKEQG